MSEEINAVFKFVVLIITNLHINRNVTISQETRRNYTKEGIKEHRERVFFYYYIRCVPRDCLL